MATISYALSTIEKVKARLPNVAVSSFDTLIETLINQATGYIETFCDRRFKETAYTEERYNGWNEDRYQKLTLFLKNYPVDSGQTFKIEERISKENDTWEEIDSDDYELDPDIGLVHFDTHLPAGHQNIRVTYTAGYKIDFVNETTATHTLPFDLTEACSTLAVREFKRRDDAGINLKNKGDDQVIFLNQLDSKIVLILNQYKRIEM